MKDQENKRILLGPRFRYGPSSAGAPMAMKAIEAKIRLDANVSSGKYRYERCSCYCGGNNDVLLSERDRYGNYYPLVICKGCGIMRANPRLTKDSYRDFYQFEYRALYGDDDVDNEKLYALRVQQGRETYAFISEHVTLPGGAVVFDVGCNMGAALLPFREKGHEVAGVDYNAEYIEFGRVKTGIPLQTGGVEALRGHAKKADLIILNHVLEHFIDLGKGLDDIYGMLNPGGYVYVFVPGIFWWVENRCGGDTLGLLQNAHTWQFSLKTLQYVMECAGFEPVFGDERVASIFKKCGGSRRALSDMPSGEFDKIRCWLALAERKYFFKRLKARVLRRG